MTIRVNKIILGAAVAISLTVALSGCGTNTTASTTPTATASSATSSGLITSKQQVQSIDIKTSKGRAEVNQQINQNLQKLDDSLNALDKSMGNL